MKVQEQQDGIHQEGGDAGPECPPPQTWSSADPQVPSVTPAQQLQRLTARGLRLSRTRPDGPSLTPEDAPSHLQTQEGRGDVRKPANHGKIPPSFHQIKPCLVQLQMGTRSERVVWNINAGCGVEGSSAENATTQRSRRAATGILFSLDQIQRRAGGRHFHKSGAVTFILSSQTSDIPSE